MQVQGFVSYSRKNIAEREDFLAMLREASYFISNAVDSVWVDPAIPPATKYLEEIQRVIQTAHIAFLLISDHFFKSDFIRNHELPAIKARVAQNQMIMLPIKVGEFDETAYQQEFRDLQAWPLKGARLISISELSQSEKRYAFADLHRWAIAASKLWAQKVEMKPLGPVTDLDLKRKAEKLAKLYRQKQEEVVYALAWTFWILWETKKDYRAAMELAKKFRAELARKRFQLDWGHEPTINLLEAGLPKGPTHLQLLEVSNASRLLDPRYARLLLGMRLSEDSYLIAGQFFSELRGSEDAFKRCALIGYAWGQCLRKHGEELVGATVPLKIALGYCEKWEQEKREICECPDMRCPRGTLQIEIHRGLGAVYRRMGNRDLALSHFKKGEELLIIEDIPARIKADFLYSYGYFLFEDAVSASVESSSWHLNCKQKSQLQEAKCIFEKCIGFESEHPAAHSRLGIVKKLLGEFILEDWFHSRTLCLGHMHGETVLTAFLCGFAIRLYSLTVDAREPVGVTSQALYCNLADIFEKWPNGAPLGPLNCHFFDAKVIMWGKDLGGDDWLKRAFDLLEASCQWAETTPGNLKEKQLDGLREFESEHGIERHPSRV